MMSPQHSFAPGRKAFTLVEVLVSMTVLLILLLISAQVIGTVQSTWTSSNARVSQFREARTAFDIITRNLSQATLNTYVDYDDSYLKDGVSNANISTRAPTKYLRKSDLRFICGPSVAAEGSPMDGLLAQAGGRAYSPGHAVFFQAPLGVSHDPAYVGLDRLLCGRGYFVQYTSDEFFRPDVLPVGVPNYRYRLMEFSPPAEKNLIYDENDKLKWFQQAGAPIPNEETPIERGFTRPIADNIVALIISPQVETAAALAGTADGTAAATYQSVYSYDSAGELIPLPEDDRHRLPPLVKVVLVAIDERTADRLSQEGTPGTPPFGNDIADLIGGDDNEVDVNETVEAIAAKLRERRINYRIFSSTVSLRGAKWSR
ncbi:uncharacterized protein (TIGR02599 family) [Prosthecobacter fusiformis]|uniref:Uncharacterized protein (TIGR02599 family) n=1 Tax=Prosthecobacter fusiformis TaxID=48464 RepID=A0A4R7RZ14_9BACT|nr:Verru_Chthon cassette protein C [Prosthecobacter fusiformis]TDU71152.1 uncharacterized protein (TIGR02599 family) [Prosthecobacter fusiformis]